MAISITSSNRGTATEKTSDATLSLTPSGNLAAGSYGVLAYVGDNPSTAEGETTQVSVTSTGGRPWVKLREQTEANTAALTGSQCALFLCYLPHGLLTTDSVDIALTANATAKGAGLMELACAAGQTIVLSASGANGSNAAAATTYSVALSGLSNVAGLYIGMSACEDEVDGACTLDTAYTAAGFGSIGSGTASTPQTNVRARVGTLANTSTGDTFDHASVTSSDRATILVRLEEAPLKVLPTLVMPTYTAPTWDEPYGGWGA